MSENTVSSQEYEIFTQIDHLLFIKQDSTDIKELVFLSPH